MQVGCVVGQEILLPLRSTIIAYLLKDLCAEAAFEILTKNGRIIKGIQTIAGRIESRGDGLLGFAVNNADGHRVEMSSHAVHAKTDESEILLAPSDPSRSMPPTRRVMTSRRVLRTRRSTAFLLRLS